MNKPFKTTFCCEPMLYNPCLALFHQANTVTIKTHPLLWDNTTKHFRDWCRWDTPQNILEVGVDEITPQIILEAGVGSQQVLLLGGLGAVRSGGVDVAPISSGIAEHRVITHFVVDVEGTLDGTHHHQTQPSHKTEDRRPQQDNDEVTGLHGCAMVLLDVHSSHCQHHHWWTEKD